MIRIASLSLASLLVSLLAGACAAPSVEEESESADQDFSSREAVQLDFELDGRLVTDSSWNVKAQIQDQFLYTIGHLNGERSVGRLDKLALTNVQSTTQADGSVLVTYHAKLPVAWGKKNAVPTSYSFTLPKNVSYAGLESFTTKYKSSCVDLGAHDVDAGSMWYYFRPKRSGCTLASDDVVTFTASVTTSTQNTTGKYPEYHKVWDDNQLRVVAIFGKNEEGATTNDAGISAFNAFVRSMKTTLAAYDPTTVPAAVPADPGSANPDVTVNAQIGNGKSISVTALLVDKVSTAPASFYARYNALSTQADLIMYNGHAGLGQNVRALANQGTFVSGKYLLLFMNGCDTFAYVDGSLAQKRRALNPDDNADGTKYLDIVTNGMPSYFSSNATAATALIKGLLSIEAPKTFEQIFASIDTQQVVLVTGEEDNVFTPGMPIGGTASWTGLDASGSVARNEEKRYETAELPAGRYTFKLTGTGDADLYVKKGAAPTTSTYDCRPYIGGSTETCTIDLTAPSKIHVMVRGWAASSTFALAGR